MLRSFHLVATCLLFGTALTLRAQEIDGSIHLGDTFLGTVHDATDQDVVTFEAVKGDLVTVSAGPGKGSVLRPHVEVGLIDGGGLLGEVTALKKSASMQVVIPLTGGYALRVSGADGTLGSFKVSTKVKAPKGALNPASEPGSGQSGSVKTVFDAPAGTLLSATISPAKGSDALPGSPMLTLGAFSVDLGPYTTLKNGKLTIKKAPLPWLGTYTLAVDNTGTGGNLLAKVALKRPAIKKTTVIESHFAVALDASIALQTTSSISSFTLSGTVLDLTGEGLPATVDWSRSAPGGIKTGSFKLKAGAFTGKVPLLPEDNLITLSAGGIQAGIVIHVTFNQGYTFGGRLVLTPDVVYVNESKLVTAQIALTDPATVPTGVLLVRVLDSGDEELVTPLVDTGDLLSGDEIQGDRVYSGRGQVQLPAEGEVPYRVVVQANNGEARSEIFPLLVTAHLQDVQLASVLALQDGAQDVIDQATANGTLGQVLPQMLAALKSDPLVAEAGFSDSGNGLWVVYECGIAGVLASPDGGIKGGGPGAAAQAAPQVIRRTGASLPHAPAVPVAGQGFTDMRRRFKVSAIENQRLALGDSAGGAPPYEAWLSEPAPQDAVLPDGALAATAKNAVKSNKVRAIAAQFFDWGANDDIPEMQQDLVNDGCFDVTYSTYGAAGAGNVEDFKRLGDYGVVLISSHGDSFYNGLLSLWKDKFGWNGPFGQVILDSNMAVTNANKVTYEDDLKKGRLVLWYGTYGVTPGFIRRYTGTMPNSLVYMSICRGTFNGTLAQAFLSRGAGAFLGYSDYVAVSFCRSVGPPLLEDLLLPDTTLNDAFIPGLKETDKDPAEFFLFGANTLQLEAGVLNDGDFEVASVHQSWSTAGDARVIPFLGEFSPTQGNWMGIISTGLGFTTSSGSLKQTFCLSASAKTLTFDWNFISEEFKEYCGSIYQDYFTVTLRDTTDNDTITLLSTWVDALCGDVSPVDFSFDQGGCYATGWNTFVIDIPPSMLGHKVELTLAASDVGDSIYDTAILLDDVKVLE